MACWKGSRSSFHQSLGENPSGKSKALDLKGNGAGGKMTSGWGHRGRGTSWLCGKELRNEEKAGVESRHGSLQEKGARKRWARTQVYFSFFN